MNTVTDTTVFDLISDSLGKTIESIMIPNFADVAADVASQFGEEPPSRDSMKVLFVDAFKKVLANPGKVTQTKPKTVKKKAEKKEKESPKPKVKKTPAPKPQWLSLNEMKEQLDGTKHFCGFVADRGPNKGKFCATVLTEEHKNCGTMSADGWVPHNPEKELDAVEGQGSSMRCKKCWAKGKNGCYRKEGAAEKMYAEEFAQVAADIPEIPDAPNDDIKEPVEELVNGISSVSISNDDDENEDSDEELEECPSDNEENTEDLLNGLLDNGPVIDEM